jgi:hypothetical protein
LLQRTTPYGFVIASVKQKNSVQIEEGRYLLYYLRYLLYYLGSI